MVVVTVMGKKGFHASHKAGSDECREYEAEVVQGRGRLLHGGEPGRSEEDACIWGVVSRGRR